MKILCKNLSFLSTMVFLYSSQIPLHATSSLISCEQANFELSTSLSENGELLNYSDEQFQKLKEITFIKEYGMKLIKSNLRLINRALNIDTSGCVIENIEEHKAQLFSQQERIKTHQERIDAQAHPQKEVTETPSEVSTQTKTQSNFEHPTPASSILTTFTHKTILGIMVIAGATGAVLKYSERLVPMIKSIGAGEPHDGEPVLRRSARIAHQAKKNH